MASEAGNFGRSTATNETMRKVAIASVMPRWNLASSAYVVGECGHAWRVGLQASGTP